MEDKEKSIIKEAIAEYDLIQKVLKENTKEILRSVAKEEITRTLNESLTEDDYDIEDIEDDSDEDVNNLPVGDGSEEMGGEDLGLDADSEMGGSDDLELDGDTEMGPVDGSEDYEAEEGSEDYDLDMTSASDEEVISVYKKLSGDDEIEIISPNEVIIKDPVSGSEYNVKLGGGSSLIDQGEMDMDGEIGLEGGEDLGIEGGEDLGLEGGEDMGMEAGGEDMGMETGEEGLEDEAGEDLGLEGGDEDELAPEEEGPEEYEEEDDDELGENVVYEIELSDDDDEDVSEDIVRPKGHDKELKNTSAPNSGDIEGQKAPLDSDSGDNLIGGFDEKGKNGKGDAHAQHIMEEEDEVIDEEDVVEGEEAIEEKISTNRVRTNQAGGDLTDIAGPGGKLGRNEGIVKKYNALLTEAKRVKAENDMFRIKLGDFRQMLGETAVFNSNLTYVTKLFLEHSTTKAEKAEILGRFDNEVTTIEESKKMYKRIVSELSGKKPIAESFENKFVGKQTSSKSSQLNEARAYIDPTQSRIIELMRGPKRD